MIHIPQDVNDVLSNDIPSELKDKKLQKLWEKAGESGFSGTLMLIFEKYYIENNM